MPKPWTTRTCFIHTEDALPPEGALDILLTFSLPTDYSLSATGAGAQAIGGHLKD
jgi:hypothetical protein